ALTIARSRSRDHQQLSEWLSEIDINAVAVGTLDSLAEQFLADFRLPGTITPATIEAFLAESTMRRHGLFEQERFRNVDLERFMTPLVPAFPGPRAMRTKLRFTVSFADRVRHDEVEIAQFRHIDPGAAVLCDAVRDYLTQLDERHVADFARLESLFLQRL